jgi:hypothetical protein
MSPDAPLKMESFEYLQKMISVEMTFKEIDLLQPTGCSVEASYLKICRLETRIEHFSLKITQHIHHFHQ